MKKIKAVRICAGILAVSLMLGAVDGLTQGGLTTTVEASIGGQGSGFDWNQVPVDANHIVIFPDGGWTIVDGMIEHPSSLNWIGWIHISRDGSPPPWGDDRGGAQVLNRPLWDSPEHRNPNPVHRATNGAVQRFLEDFHTQHRRSVSRNPVPHEGQIPRWTPEDERLSQEFVRGFIDAASKDSFFGGMPFNIAYMEEILTHYRVYFAPGRAADYAGWASAGRREIFVSTPEDSTAFARTSVHEIAHALGLGEQLAHLWDSEIVQFQWYYNFDLDYSIRSTWYRCTNMDRTLLNKVSPVDFWRAAFTSNQAYAELWDMHMSHITTFDDMQVARTVATHASGLATSFFGNDIILTNQIRQDISIAAPITIRTREIHTRGGQWHDTSWALQQYQYENGNWDMLLNTLAALTFYTLIAHNPEFRLAQSDRIIEEANRAIVQLANYGRQHNLQSVEAVFDWTFYHYLHFNDMYFPSHPPNAIVMNDVPMSEATTAAQSQLRFQLGSYTYTLNGTPHQTAVAPFVGPGGLMVPLYIVAEALDAEVGWIAATRTVTINRDALNLSLVLDRPLPNNMGTPLNVGGRTFLPVAYVSQIFDVSTGWNEATRAIYIYL